MDDQGNPVRLDIPVLRASRESAGLRATGDNQMPTMFGHFSVFGTWYEIDSWYEGRFVERILPGAFERTLREDFSNIKVMLEHGTDFQVNEKPLGRAQVLREDETGPYYENSLYDVDYVRQLLPALEDGQYGSSFRFRVLGDSWDREPKRSDHNPEGLPERSVTEVKTFEYGPTVWPANPDATTGIRSLTDLHYERIRRATPGLELSGVGNRTPVEPAQVFRRKQLRTDLRRR